MVKTIPPIGYGTYKLEKDITTKWVYEAIKMGYRHIDCAKFYANQKEVGEALNVAVGEGIVKREDLWITSKLWITVESGCSRDEIMKQAEQTMRDLGVSYMDLYLIHWPLDNTPKIEWTDKDTWMVMEEIKDKGMAKNIGVSNYNLNEIDALLKYAKHRPYVNQVECHPRLQQPALRLACNVEVYDPVDMGCM
eukprot:GHVO01068498.1.p1 GENE.GHVO01068498.1~~GHVO01068498.1.p1  ORF type:complete len:193 (+),score=28.56 GHVO01068498.1:242-820(+)